MRQDWIGIFVYVYLTKYSEAINNQQRRVTIEFASSSGAL